VPRPTKLTPEVHRTIVEYIRAGAYDHVAAQAAGIAPSTFRRWLERGAPGRPPYRAFAADVAQARAQARVAAEIEVRRDHPLSWLRYGPGRERPGAPGWTQSVQHEHSGPEGGPIPVATLIRLFDALPDEDADGPSTTGGIR